MEVEWLKARLQVHTSSDDARGDLWPLVSDRLADVGAQGGRSSPYLGVIVHRFPRLDRVGGSLNRYAIQAPALQRLNPLSGTLVGLHREQWAPHRICCPLSVTSARLLEMDGVLDTLLALSGSS